MTSQIIEKALFLSETTGGNILSALLIIGIFTAVFIVSGILTYKIRMKNFREKDKK